MTYANKTYVCFDADTDMHYYRTMQMWKENDKIDFDFYNAHDLNNLRDWSTEDTIKRKLRERLLNSKNFIVLIWENTKNLYKFVRREMEAALDLNLPIIGVNLNNKRSIDNNLCPPIIKDELVVYTSFNMKAIKHALDYRTNEHYDLKKQWVEGDRYYSDSVYEWLWL